jgi:hypothetical protein
MLKTMSSWRYATQTYAHPRELKWAQRFIEIRKPKEESL